LNLGTFDGKSLKLKRKGFGEKLIAMKELSKLIM